MSSSIWMQCAGASRVGRLEVEAWRVVEAQHQISTRRLVDSDEEQRLLEELIDASKPPQPVTRRLHYLLATPFRYPPLRHGSRFATRYDRSLWYGAETVKTAFAEVAFYRFVFLAGTRAALGTVHTELTSFSAAVRTERGVDLTRRPFSAHESALTSRTSYADTQPLGGAMREAGVEAVRYRSARDPDGGCNIGVFDAGAFGSARPRRLESWHCTTSPDTVEVVRRDYFGRASYSFARDAFVVDGRLPSPA
jgi:hypothetical protein